MEYNSEKAETQFPFFWDSCQCPSRNQAEDHALRKNRPLTGPLFHWSSPCASSQTILSPILLLQGWEGHPSYIIQLWGTKGSRVGTRQDNKTGERGNTSARVHGDECILLLSGGWGNTRIDKLEMLSLSAPCMMYAKTCDKTEDQLKTTCASTEGSRFTISSKIITVFQTSVNQGHYFQIGHHLYTIYLVFFINLTFKKLQKEKTLYHDFKWKKTNILLVSGNLCK